MESQLPRQIRKGPLITVTCECGEGRQLHYGERWRCESCGRSFDTNKIPLEEYAAIRRKQLGHRMVPLVSGVFLLAGVILSVVENRAFGALIVVPFLLSSWNMFVRPFFRARYRRSLARDLPTWNIEAD